MELEEKDDFEIECELITALEWRPAPPDLKRKVMQRRYEAAARRRHALAMWWQRLAASSFGFDWRRKGGKRNSE